DDALYRSPAEFLAAEFLERVIHEAREVMGVTHLVFTGGEPTLHPEFAKLLDIGAANRLTMAFVTNGWHFDRIWPSVLAHRSSISAGFSIDGVTRESHDYWRGEGSFVRLVRAFARCHAHEIPFAMKIAIRRDTAANLEQIAIFAARMGAASLNFTHVMPTSTGEEGSSLSLQERRLAEQEIANLSRIFKMKIGIDVGYYNLDPSPPCSALAGVSANIDYLGRLTLCCNLSGFRGAVGQADIIADLNLEDFSTAFARLSTMVSRQLEARRKHLAMLAKQGITPDLYSGSPCLFCLETLGKLPWRQTSADLSNAGRSLPVLMRS
ncbi:MAG TPA: radical SAM protein, partial [Pyrinomonadaceae bacterium]|nr:radical SAM protein [Pyrinomonadaceae bacterium]